MRENRTSGTVWGVSGNRHSYHDGLVVPSLERQLFQVEVLYLSLFFKIQ